MRRFINLSGLVTVQKGIIMKLQTKFTLMPSPIGDILLARNENGISHIHFQAGDSQLSPASDWQRADTDFEDLVTQLNAYFAGELQAFNLPLAPDGTPFQQTVWQQLQTIPYGKTATYGELAAEIGKPKASRAVGAANGRNPLPIIIPCHRVIGANGKLTGFSGGLHIKEALLALEQNGRCETTTQLELF